MLPLAQLSADMVSPIVQWIIGLSGTIFLLNQALTFYKEHIKESPTPAGTYATRSEMDAELGRERSSRKKIHEEISELQREMMGLKKENDNQSRDIVEIKTYLAKFNDRFDALPQRLITLLRETKGLI